MLKLILLFVLLCGVAVFAYVQHKRTETQSILVLVLSRPPNQPSVAIDRTFVDRAANSGIYGLLLGTIGMERSQNRDVQVFAEYMIHGNQRLNLVITALIERSGITTARTLEPDQRFLLQQLSQLSGPGFDSNFLVAALTECQKMRRAFQKELESGRDIDLQKFASRSIQTLKDQISLGERLLTEFPVITSQARGRRDTNQKA